MAAIRILRLFSKAEESETRTTVEMPASRLGVFKAAMSGKNKLFRIMILNFMAVIGAALGIFYYLTLMVAEKNLLGDTSPFSSNLATGYPLSVGTGKSVALEFLKIDFRFFTLLVPSLVILGIVLSGVFYVVKKWAYIEDDFNISKAFFIGIKKNVFNFIIIFLLLGGVLWLFNFALQGIITAQIYNGNSFFLVFAIVLLSLVLSYYLIMTLFMCTLAVTYKMNIFKLIKNSFLLTAGFIIRNIIIAVLCFVPVALFFVPGIFSTIAIMFYLFYGIMLAVVGFTVYSHWAFEKVDKLTVSAGTINIVENKEKGDIIEGGKACTVEKSEDADFSPTSNASQNKNKKKSFANPKKKRK